jgi:hypothetical protein
VIEAVHRRSPEIAEMMIKFNIAKDSLDQCLKDAERSFSPCDFLQNFKELVARHEVGTHGFNPFNKERLERFAEFSKCKKE